MSKAELEAVLVAAFRQCEIAGCALSDAQKQVLRETITAQLCEPIAADENPLTRLTSDQRQAFFEFVKSQQNQSWKATLLDDWLHDRDSGNVQFVRDLYGIPWLESITATHLAEYEDEAALRLKVGDRIEVSNALWEWVQDTGPCSREWFPCRVVSVRNASDLEDTCACTIRFDDGSEYEIQGVYDWNRSNWRWMKE